MPSKQLLRLLLDFHYLLFTKLKVDPNQSILIICIFFSEGTLRSDPRLGRYSGTVSSNTVLVSKSGSIYLYMTSDESITNHGFLASYSIAGTFLTFFGD